MMSQGNRYLTGICQTLGTRNRDQALRALVGRFKSPDDSLETVAAKLGVRRITLFELPFDGGVFEEDGQLIIKLNKFSSPRRRRFTLAHELAHLIVADVMKFAEKTACRTRLGCGQDRKLESTCDQMAAEILMPPGQLHRLVEDYPRATPENLRVVADHFGVSLQSAAIRLVQLGIWKASVACWECKPRATEVWSVGKRIWATRRPVFVAFELALERGGSVRTREFCADARTFLSLTVMHIGGAKVVGILQDCGVKQTTASVRTESARLLDPAARPY